MMALAMGPSYGVGQMPTKGGMVIGSTITSMLKSKGLFAKKSWSNLNQSLDWKKPTPAVGKETAKEKGTKSKNLAAALGISEEEAKELMQVSLPLVDRQDGEART